MKDDFSPSKASRRWFRVVTTIAHSLFESVGSPVALAQSLRLKNREFLQLVSTQVDPRDYTCAASFAADYLVSEVFSKFPSWDTKIDKGAVAVAKFLDSESLCFETNRRLRSRSRYAFKSGYSAAAVLFTARRKIEWLLGDFSWSEAERFFGFGPGASYSLSRRLSDPYYKFSGIPETTRECAVAGDCLVRSIPAWEFHVRTLLFAESKDDSLVAVVPGNRVTTVPKNAKTDRVIAIEPLLNMFLQKGIGGVIRQRLRRVGVDLNDQVPNQELAREGSITGGYATIDLSSASDSVSEALVEALLPPDWHAALELCRSRQGILPSGERITYQKFSSMGNGYTFELESLIFWALISSVFSLTGRVGSNFRVYGDDLIVPTESAEPLIEVLSYCGFSCNEKKTFVDGPFRESCGKHYFRGVDVTPFYLRKEMNVEQLLLWCNNLRRYSRLAYGLDGRFKAAYLEAVSMLPEKLRRPRIPDGFGDAALIGDFDEALPARAKHGWEGWTAVVRLPVMLTRQVDGWPYLLRTLLRMPDRLVSKEVELGRTAGGANPTGSIPSELTYVNCKVHIPQWADAGPWLTP